MELTQERVEYMDINMLLSIVNLKLRDEFDSLETMCDRYDISQNTLVARLSEADYTYIAEQNQFK